MAQQCNHSAEHWRQSMFLPMVEDMAVVETQSLQWFQRLQGRGMRPSLRLNLC